MHRRSLSIIVTLALVLAAVPLSASQFIDQPFDRVAREATYVVRGTIDNTWSAWDDAHEVIYTYATLKVSRYFGDTSGPATLMVREVGGTVDGYTQEAIGFPAIRGGEEVVLMLSKWDGSADLRIHAYNQGKYLIRNRGGIEVLIGDPVKQGEARLSHDGVRANAFMDEEPGITIDEFAGMVSAARLAKDLDKRQ